MGGDQSERSRGRGGGQSLRSAAGISLIPALCAGLATLALANTGTYSMATLSSTVKLFELFVVTMYSGLLLLTVQWVVLKEPGNVMAWVVLIGSALGALGYGVGRYGFGASMRGLVPPVVVGALVFLVCLVVLGVPRVGGYLGAVLGTVVGTLRGWAEQRS